LTNSSNQIGNTIIYERIFNYDKKPILKKIDFDQNLLYYQILFNINQKLILEMTFN